MLDERTIRELVREADRLGYPGITPWLNEAGWPARIEHQYPLERLRFFLGRTNRYCAVARAVGRGEVPLRADGSPYRDVKDPKARARRHLQYFAMGRTPTGRWDTGALIPSLLDQFRVASAHDPQLVAEIDAHASELSRSAAALNQMALIGHHVPLGSADILRPGERAVYVACDSVLLDFVDDDERLVLKIGSTTRDVWGRALQLSSRRNRTGRSGNLVVLRVYRATKGAVASDHDNFHGPLTDRGVLPGDKAEPGRGREFRLTTLRELDKLALEQGLLRVDLTSATRRVILP